MRRACSLSWIAVLLVAAPFVHAQERGAPQLHALVNGLTVTARVLIIGARPTDADADLIAWLARGHHVQAAYLSLTRGESAPNYTGLESGATLGAVHVAEMLAARRIDGGEQYFTRAYDFGSARDTTEVFSEWDHTELLGDVVTVVRSFRPHVIISLFRADSSDGDGQHQTSAVVAREAFSAAADTLKFSTAKHGLPWSVSSAFEPGTGVSIDSRDYDRMLGRTYADIAVESRSQLRSFGFATPPWTAPRTTLWGRVASRVADSAATGSLFAGIDTSFARLLDTKPQITLRRVTTSTPTVFQLTPQLPLVLAYADSARAALDLQNPAKVLRYLSRVSDLVSSARAGLRGCRHPARDALVTIANYKCQSEWLDLDASLDLVQQRATGALLGAAGISFEAVADRELLASGDSARVTITAFNNGDANILLNDVSPVGAPSVRMTAPIVVPAHGSASVQRTITSIAYAHPWWIWRRERKFYPPSISPLDGVPRLGLIMSDFGISGTAMPENMRRLSDVRATLTIGSSTLTASVGTVVYKIADPVLGIQERELSGVSAVTLVFERALEWAQARKPLRKQVRLIVRNFSDKPQQFSLKSGMSSAAARLDSLPPPIHLQPHESREITLLVRGTPGENRYDLGIKGIASRDTFETGFRTAQYAYLPPLRLFRDPNISVLGVDVEIPNRLSVAYIRGAGDDADVALKGLGVPTYVFNNEGLTRFDLEGVSTVVIGPDAFRVDRALLTQMSRLTEFARKGGTVVMLDNAAATTEPGVLPFPVAYAEPLGERVMREDAPVAAIERGARVLTWPNVIRDADWQNWVGARALSLPTTVDPHYSLIVEAHDPNQKDNRNSILVATVGKGRFIYTSLTLTQQISNAVPGAMRVFVNLLSAGLPVEDKVAKSEAK